MSSKPILKYLQILDRQIAYEKEKINISLRRIRQLRDNFMMNYKIKTLNKEIVYINIIDSEQKILELKAKKKILSMA